jgi:hypothetical protein
MSTAEAVRVESRMSRLKRITWWNARQEAGRVGSGRAECRVGHDSGSGHNAVGSSI